MLSDFRGELTGGRSPGARLFLRLRQYVVYPLQLCATLVLQRIRLFSFRSLNGQFLKAAAQPLETDQLKTYECFSLRAQVSQTGRPGAKMAGIFQAHDYRCHIMRICAYLSFWLMLVILCAGGVEAGSAAGWKPERMPGSARLALNEIRFIYLPPDPSDRLQAAVKDLMDCWPVQVVKRPAAGVPPKEAIVLQRGLVGEGFRYRRDRTRVYLNAASDEGLAYGIYAICRDLLGARWYWAGAHGFERVGEIADKFPERVWRERPAFVQRSLYPVDSDFARRNRLNGKYSFNHNLARIFTAEVYASTPEVFATIEGKTRRPQGSAKYDPQPDFTEPRTVELAAAAAREQFRNNPDSNSFSLSINDNVLFDEGAATEAVVVSHVKRFAPRDCDRRIGDRTAQRISRERRSPDRLAQRTEDRRKRTEDGGIDYFRGRPNYTDLVFGFMNEVAERLWPEGQGSAAASSLRKAGQGITNIRADRGRSRATIESRIRSAISQTGISNPLTNLISDLCPPTSEEKPPYLTALAYYWTEQSPSLRVHPRVMPVLTSDRAQWHDPEYRRGDKALIRRWADSGAERIATWDYYFGAPYPYPRQFTQWIGESIPYLHEAGVDVFFSQLPSVWGLDGPKAWITAELLRDPQQDLEALLSEYYQNFFGPAAEPMRQFYSIAEQTRNERAGTANWIKFYRDEAGIELFTPESLVRMRECIERAMEQAGDGAADDGVFDDMLMADRYLKRVGIVSEAFGYTEAYAAYHRSRVQLVEQALALQNNQMPGGDDADLVQTLAAYQSAKAKFNELKVVLAQQPMHRGFSTFNRVKQSDPLPLVMAALAGTDFEAELVEAEEAMGALLAGRVSGEVDFIPAGVNPGLKHSGTERRNFLGPEMPLIDGWDIRYRASEGLRLQAAVGVEAAGLRVEGSDVVALVQAYPVISERAYLLRMEAGWQVSPDNRTRLQLNWESTTGERLRTDLLLRLPNGKSKGNQTLEFAFTAPNDAYKLNLGVVTDRQYKGDYLELRRIELGKLVARP